MKPVTLWVLFIIFIVTRYVESYGILHKILKVSEDATVEEMRLEFHKLLRQWYKASKSFSSESEILHLKIVQAYKELKTDMDMDFRDKHLLTSDYYRATIQNLDIDVLHGISVPLRLYNTELMQNSNKSLHLVLFYTVNSSSTRVIHEWFNLLEILTPLGVVMVTINMDKESFEDTKNIVGEYPTTFPYLLLLVDGVTIPYDSEFYDFLIMDFIRKNLPTDLLQIISDKSAKKFLNSWHTDNKVRALLFQQSLPVRLQYLLIAFLHRNSVLFGFIDMSNDNTIEIRQKMNASRIFDTLLLFKENQEIPCKKLSLPVIPAKVLNNTLFENSFLTLPRITSQEMFDTICPINSQYSKIQASLCIILVIENSLHGREFDPKTVFRRFIEEYSRHFKEVSFMYVYNDYQPGFVLPIEDEFTKNLGNAPHVIALKRIDKDHVKYMLLMNGHSNWEDYENTKERLKLSIEEVIDGKQTLLLDTFKLNEFINEKPPGLIYRIMHRLQMYINKITLENFLPYVIFVVTVIYFVAYFSTHWRKIRWTEMNLKWFDVLLLSMNNLMGPHEEEKYKESFELKKRVPNCHRKDGISPEVFLKNGKCITTSRELRLHELKAETYNGMVRLLKPGCRTIILMFDRVRADLLVSQFYKAVWPYRKNKNLLFGYANMEKKASLEWYSELVKACLPEQQEIEINPYFCAGTVLALSGMRKYFCLYHIKHPGILPSKEKAENFVISTKFTTYTDEELLKGLREWLDKLFDGSGSVIRYRVNHWPEFKIL